MPLALRTWMAVGPVLGWIAPPVLRRRLARGKEDPARWREKLGEASQARPDGPLVWLHAVGLGEVLALRGLIGAMAAARPELSFLVTSTARSSSEVIGRNLPGRTRHQFLPLDVPAFRRRFLDHWRPDLCVWSEQDLWPGFIVDAARRGVPQALVNARLDAEGFRGRMRLNRVYSALFARLGLISAQDAATAARLERLGAPAPVEVLGSIKPAAPSLVHDEAERQRLAAELAGRTVWLAGPTHPEDEAVALAAQRRLLLQDASALLILAPRDPVRAPEVLAACEGLVTRQRTAGSGIGAAQVLVADTFGEMGLWYRLAGHALIGGTFGPVEGHNPWEAAALGCAILHGPRTGNFAEDYATLDAAGGAVAVGDAGNVLTALAEDGTARAGRARAVAGAAQERVEVLARRLVGMIR